MGLLSALTIGTKLLGAHSKRKAAKRAAQQTRDISQMGYDRALGFGREANRMAQFRGFGVRSGLGGGRMYGDGGMRLALSPEQQRMQNMLFSRARGLFAQAETDPAVAQAALFEQMRDIQRPEEERARLAVEERALSQGRLGLGLDRFGGSTPEMLARATAEQEAMGKANLAARQQALAEQQSLYNRASGLFSLGYVPQQQLLNQMGYGLKGASLAQSGREAGAGMFGQFAAGGLGTLTKGQFQAAGMDLSRRNAGISALTNLATSAIDAYGNRTPAPTVPSYTSISPVPTAIGQPIPAGVNNLGTMFSY